MDFVLQIIGWAFVGLLFLSALSVAGCFVLYPVMWWMEARNERKLQNMLDSIHREFPFTREDYGKRQLADVVDSILGESSPAHKA
ncbi:MAG: hypothetical protein FWG56_12040 [Desulfovibrionaceae bacterium]|jgi:hypothetical protein|nr:hypothetical protein [Desulfovibrionaceae bacterium]